MRDAIEGLLARRVENIVAFERLEAVALGLVGRHVVALLLRSSWQD